MDQQPERTSTDPAPVLPRTTLPDPVPLPEPDRLLPIAAESDLTGVRQKVLALARKHSASDSHVLIIATITSELCRNILEYAGNGVIALDERAESGRTGIRIIAADDGPGIEDCHAALIRGYSTSGGAGLGLPGVQTLADEFHLDSSVGRGTRVTVTKWLD